MLSEDKMLAAYTYLIIFFGLDTTEKQSPLSLTVPHWLPPSMHSSSPEKSELDHSNVSKLFSTSEMKKLTLQYFSVTLDICTANSNIQESSSFSLIFLGLICYLAQTLEDPEEPERAFCKQSYQTCLVSWFSNWQPHFSSQEGEHSRDLFFVRYTEV